MRRLILLSTFLFCAATHAEQTVFVNVNVVPMTSEQVLAGQTVIVTDGRITEMGPVDAIAVPKDAAVVDGTDRYLMPGLAEMHAHVGAIPAFERLATLFVANGITTIRGMLGRDSHIDLRDRLAGGSEFGPRLITSGPSLNGRSVAGAAEAGRMVREQQQRGFDFIKIHPGLDSSEFDAMAAAANEIGMPYAGHVPVAAGVRRALEFEMATIDHLDGYFAAMMPPNSTGRGGYGGFFDVLLADDVDQSQIDSIAAETAAAGTWNVPTQILVEQLVDATPVAALKARPEMRYVPLDTLRSWGDAKNSQLAESGFDAEVAARGVDLRRRLIKALHDAGAGLLLGSDAPQVFNVPGFSTHRELSLLVESGLSPYEALRTGTVAVAEFLGTNTGEIAVGRDADLVLLDDNPLADVSNAGRIHGVMVRGQWFSRRDLNARLDRFVVGKRD